MRKGVPPRGDQQAMDARRILLHLGPAIALPDG
jgi:hypothetical protein